MSSQLLKIGMRFGKVFAIRSLAFVKVRHCIQAQTTLMGGIQKSAKIFQRAVARVDVEVIGDVVTIVPQRRGIKRQQPDGGYAELLQVIESVNQAAEVADTICVAVVKRLYVQLVNDGVFIPKRVHAGVRITFDAQMI